VARPSEDHEISRAVKRAVDGNTEAYGAVYGFYMDRIYRYVYYQVGDRMMAEDITQEVFIKAWKSIGNCRGQEQTFSAWLYRVARNHMVDVLRRNHREVSIDNIELTDDHNLEREVEDGIEWQGVLRAISDLPDPQKQVILLKFLEGADNGEISRIMGKKEGAVRALHMRALMNLRERLTAGVDSRGR
jgi:RNA polymerase sigma-70 factor (ECF subfamily)